MCRIPLPHHPRRLCRVASQLHSIAHHSSLLTIVLRICTSNIIIQIIHSFSFIQLMKYSSLKNKDINWKALTEFKPPPTSTDESQLGMCTVACRIDVMYSNVAYPNTYPFHKFTFTHNTLEPLLILDPDPNPVIKCSLSKAYRFRKKS